MDNGVLLETKTLVELIRHYIRHYFRISPLLVPYEVRKFAVFGSYLKRN